MFEQQIPENLRRSDITIDFVAPRNGAKILDSFYEFTLADAFVLDAGMAAEKEGYDAVCINSMSDSGLHALRSCLSIPVIGPCEATLLTACMTGQKFSILTMWDRWKPMYMKTIREQGLQTRLASIRAIGVNPDAEELLAGKEEVVFDLLKREGEAAIEKDGADVIILGSTTMYQSYDFLSANLPVPVLNPGLIALKTCEMFLDLGMAHSPRYYQPPREKDENLFSGVECKFA
ncbi:aspartate/glutamate racemase family protein [Emcibacter nanhaiensis]|nr:aspartate/glutamate racemase family protein [Emcibacter nanhaiensis]